MKLDFSGARVLVVGDVMLDPGTQTASLGISYDDLLSGLGLSAAAAEYLGSVDDLSLRYANPDIDGDGKIDLEQDRRYGLDFHVRSNLRLGSSAGRNLTVADLTDQFAAESGPSVATVVGVVAGLYAVLVAFVIVNEWEAYVTAQTQVSDESAALTTAYENSSVLSQPSRQHR